jgi:UDP-N-acetylmuramoylalanine--D-glutamate ligase
VQYDRTLVVGLGATGLATARYLAALGADVTVIDSRAVPPGLAELRETHPEIPVILESQDPRWLEGIDQVALSPGLRIDTPLAAHARQQGIPLVGDIELFARAVQAPVLAVTGSNGKSTVVTLLERMLSATGLDVAAGGNLGPPALELLAEPADIYLLEISSFQLETTESLRPDVATVLNVSPDHLDRHGSLAAYAALKSKLLRCDSGRIQSR